MSDENKRLEGDIGVVKTHKDLNVWQEAMNLAKKS
jgi:hypothetical protein